MTSNDKKVEVIKLNPQGEETWRYDGLVLARDRTSILIEAYFNRDNLLFNGILLKKNDRFVERYFNDRWYNIFEIHDREDDQIKGWYCNITKPAKITPGRIAYIDLALDVLVYPNGSYLVLDKDEFDDLEIDENSRKQAMKALDALVSLADTGHLTDMINTDIDAPQ